MEHETFFTRRFWWLAGIAVCLPLVWFLYQLFGPNEQIIVSPETTVITAPFRADGLPDYARYFYELGHEGVTPENNGAVPFWQAMWPGDLAREDWLPMCAALGMETVPAESSGLKPPYSSEMRKQIARFLTEHYQNTLEDVTPDELMTVENQQTIVMMLADDAIGEAMERPWQSEQLPPLATWVERNEKQLDFLVAASQRPKFWSPSPSLLGKNYQGLIAVLLPNIQTMRTAARALNLRAMWHLGEGRNAAAWADLRACHRLARFTSNGPTLVEQLVGIAMDGIACQQTVTLLHFGNLEAKLARQILQDLTEMGPPSEIVRSLDTGERLLYADTVLGLATQRDTLSSLTGAGGSPQFDPSALVSIKWNYVLREGNRWYDRLVAAAKLPTRAERKASFVEFERALRQTSAAVKNPYRLIGGLFSSQTRSEILADTMSGLMLPALQAAYEAEERALVAWQLTRVAAALAVYRAEDGAYPERLVELVPEILPEMSIDLYSDEPFKYERKPAGGYLLYSVFKNGKDDGGSNFAGEIIAGEWVEEGEVDYDNSDIVIRVPVPEFKLPEFPVEEDPTAPPDE